MRNKKGVLVEASGNSGIILTRDGQFRKARLVGYGLREVGREVEYQDTWFTPSRIGLVSAAACLVLIVALGAVLARPYFGARRVLAYVSLDINPSVELGVDGRYMVRSSEGLNEDGNALLARVNVKNRQLRDAVLELIDGAVNGGYMIHGEQNAVLIASVPGEDGAVPDSLLEGISGIKREVERELEARKVNAVVESVSGGTELRKKAKELNVSPGRMALALKALAEGAKLSEEDIRKGPLNRIIGNAQRLREFKLGDSDPKQIEELVKQLNAKKLKLESPPAKSDTSNGHEQPPVKSDIRDDHNDRGGPPEKPGARDDRGRPKGNPKGWRSK